MTTGFRRGAKISIMIVCAWWLSAAHASGDTLTVTTTQDTGPGSLRQAIADAAPGDTIVVTATGTMTLAGGSIAVSTDVTISGPGASALTIDPGRSSRIFTIGTPLARVTAAISGLTLRNGSAVSGGAILNDGVLTLTNVVLSDNTATIEGGAILNRGTLRVVQSLITANTAAMGGGISNSEGFVSIERTTLSRNTAAGPYGGGGGAIASRRGYGDFGGGGAQESLDISDSAFTDNAASWKGGAIFLATGLMTMTTSTVAGNTCTYTGDGDACLCAGGGGIYNVMGKAVIVSSTIAGNSAFVAGGNVTSLYGLTTLKTTLVAQGASGPNCFSYLGGALVSDGYNLSDDASCAGALTGVGDLNAIPAGLSPMGPQLNQGITPTIALLPGAVLDTVPPEACTSADQRGMPRPQGGGCDIGAYERSAAASAYSAEIQPPIKADGTTVFNANRGVIPVKFVLTRYGTPACDVSATIGVARLSGTSTGPISDTTFELPADRGNTFRVDTASCQYTYNLATATLTPGTYWVSLSVGEVIGQATFGIR